MNTEKTDYLAAAITRSLYERGACAFDEIMAQLEDHYDGKADPTSVLMELTTLTAAGSIEEITDEDGMTLWMDADD